MLRVLTTITIFALMCAPIVWAQDIPVMPRAPDIAARSYILMDADTQMILVEFNSDEPMPPASLTKIMTHYVATKEIDTGRLLEEELVTVSVNAWQTEGSKMFIREGTSVKVGDLLKGIVIQSGNDASIAIAEHIAGSEDAFADMMNAYAEYLGLSNSSYVNATGLPDEQHYSSARDMALLSRALINEHPDQYRLYAELDFTYNGIQQSNRNRLLRLDQTVDGIKTGYTKEAGFCLAVSSVRNGMRLISVVMGTDSEEVRTRETRKLLSYGFRNFETRKIHSTDDSFDPVRVYYGVTDQLSLGIGEDLVLTIPRGRYTDLKAVRDLPKRVEAPIKKGENVGRLRVLLDDSEITALPLLALEDVREAGFFSKMKDAMLSFFESDNE